MNDKCKSIGPFHQPMYCTPPQFLEIPSTMTILLSLLSVVAGTFLLSYINLAFSLNVNFQSALLRTHLATCSSQVVTCISGLAAFPRLAIFTSEIPAFRSELASYRSELALLTSKVAELQREWLDINDRNKSLEREVAGSTWMGGSKLQLQDTTSSTPMQQERSIGFVNRQDQQVVE
jgi:hypothetical protein